MSGHAPTPEPPPEFRPAPAPQAATPPRFPLFEFERASGGSFGSEDLAGRVWLAAFVPRVPARGDESGPALLGALAGLGPGGAAGRDVPILLFLEDADPAAAQALRAAAVAGGLGSARLVVLRGPPDEVRLLRSVDLAGETEADLAGDVLLVDRYGRVRQSSGVGDAEALAALAAAVEPLLRERTPKRVAFPEGSLDPAWLGPRAEAQRAAARSWSVRHDFRFVDRRRASGIDFMHRCVDDSGKDYKPVHYDHGSGVAVADVDGDGWLDLYFCNQVGSNQLWRNLGDGRFEDVTERAGVGMRAPCGVTASFADTDNDGDPDLYVTSVRGGNFLFRNDGTGRFEDVTKEAGLVYEGHSSAGVFFDYDRDGLLDLLLCNVGVYTNDTLRVVEDDTTTSGLEPGPFEYYDGVPDAFSGHLHAKRAERSILYRNLGENRFRDVSEAVGLLDTSWTGDASPIDMNEDGWIDLYVLNMQGHDEYYENQGGQKFIKRSRAVFPRTPWGSMGIKVFDFDQDGRLDLYLTDMHSDMSRRVGPAEEKRKSQMVWPESLVRSGGQSIFGNAFYRRTGPDRVEEISDAIGAENYWPWGLSVGDLNADGFGDAFITASMNYFYRYGVNSVLLNEAGKRFVDAEFVLGVEPRRGPLFKPWFDLDCMDERDATHPLCENEQLTVLTAWAPLGSRSSVIFDLDGDGDLDIVTNDMNSEPLVLVSDLADRHEIRFLKLRLVGSGSNRDGLGSIVRLVAGGRTWTQVHDGQSGYLSQSSQPLYFGLGDATSVARIEIDWPSGRKQVIAAPGKLNRTLEVREGEE